MQGHVGFGQEADAGRGPDLPLVDVLRPIRPNIGADISALRPSSRICERSGASSGSHRRSSLRNLPSTTQTKRVRMLPDRAAPVCANRMCEGRPGREPWFSASCQGSFVFGRPTRCPIKSKTEAYEKQG